MKNGDAHLSPESYLCIAASFVTTSVGGFLMGLSYGIFTAALTKVTPKTGFKLQMPAILALAYLAFINAQYWHLSGIMALIGCGLADMRYTFNNLTDKTRELVVTVLHVIAHSRYGHYQV